MKKQLLLTALAFLMGTIVRAQSFEFRYHGQSLTDGEVVTIAAVPDEFGFGEFWCESNPSSNPDNGLVLKLLSGTTASGTASITIERNTLNPQTLKWCMGGECSMLNDKTALDKSFSVSNGTVQVQFDAENCRAEGDLLATLTSTIGSETHTVKILFTYGAAADTKFWWGYFSEAYANGLPYEGCLGYSSAVTIDAAIFVPANHPIVGKGTVKSVRFWLGDDLSKISSDLTVWISKSLPSKASSADYFQTVSKSNLVPRMNEVELRVPYEVNNAGVYIGFSFKISGKSYPVMSYGQEDVPNSFFFRVTGNSWTDFPGSGYGYGVLALQVLVEGVELPKYDVTASDFQTGYVLKGSEIYIPVTVYNAGQESVTSINYTITTGSNTTAERVAFFGELPTFASATVDIPFAADADTRKYNKTLTITKVNGQPNASADKTASGSLITITESPTVTPVVEEFTGTWCGWCPVGFEGLKSAHETFGDRVVLIAAHNGDPMETSDYNPIMSMVSGFPSSFVNRVDDVYPSPAGLSYYINRALESTTVGSISANAMWTDESKTAININTKTKFCYSDDDSNYGIAYVLIEDGLTGTGSSWAQANYLSGNSSYSSFEFWYNAGSRVTGIEFDHVAVAAWNIANGTPNSVESQFVADEVQKYSFEADISKNSIIQDKGKLSVAVLLVDRSTGRIVNAAQTSIMDFDAAVDAVRYTSSAVEKYYSLDGRKMSAPHKGLNIMKMSDGTIRKVMVK